MTNIPCWVTTALDPDRQILNQQCKVNFGGRVIDGNLQIEDARERGNTVQYQVSANFNPLTIPGTIALSKYYLEQIDMDAFQSNPSQHVFIIPNPN